MEVAGERLTVVQARAIKSAKQAVPGAPNLIEWRQERADGIWEFQLTPEVKAALARRSDPSEN
jgi:hypothetical protein